MKWRYPVLIFGGICCSAWGFIYRPFPMPGEEPLLDLLLYHTPNFYIWVVRWYYVAPAVAVVVGGLIVSTIYHVWFEKVEDHLPSYKVLPDWPLSPKKDAGPGIVVGEVHHPVKAVEIPNPKWLVIPERGLYTGVALLHDSTAARVGAFFQLLVQDTTAQDFGLPSSAIRLRM